jgi:plasmid rolling circle replication initiator protein Rep
LTDYSPKDKPWDDHRTESDAVQTIYQQAQEFEGYAARISKCSGLLMFAEEIDPETGEVKFRLRKSQFCRVRHCPVCQWRRSLMWQARFYSALPGLVEAAPSAKWVFLTLTVRNCDITDLKSTLSQMNQAWQRLIKRKQFFAKGWLRTTEVTRGMDGSAHPHFHVLMQVSSNYFTKNYVTHEEWITLWQEAMRLDYRPSVRIQTVRPKPGQEAKDALQSAVAETLKYSVKPADMVEDSEWFLEMTRQVHKLRFVASGGTLKDVLRECEETNEDLIQGGDTAGQDTGKRLAFKWDKPVKKYRRAPSRDLRGKLA